MPAKDFKGPLNRQRTSAPGTGQGRLGVVGTVPNPIREELERATEQLPVREIPIEQLHDNPFQQLARPVLDEETLEELASSIRQNGFYGALLARRKRGAAEQYEIAYGHRRREAARRAGLATLPVKVIEINDTQMARIMASENFSREDLTPLGEANVVGYLSTAQNMSIEEIAGVIGKKRGWVQPRIQLFEAPQDIKDMVEQKPETLSHVRLLRQISDGKQRASLIQNILENDLTFEQLRTHLDSLKQGAKARQIDKNITSNSSAVDSEALHNVSHETRSKREFSNTDTLLSHGEIIRQEALSRLDKAAKKFENLAEKTEYELSDHEKGWLRDIVERLNALLEG